MEEDTGSSPVESFISLSGGMADTPDLGSGFERHGGSSPS